MKYLFAAAFALILGLYTIAQWTRQLPPRDGIVRLRWSTDPNPSRAAQTSTFTRLNPGIEAYVDPGLGGDHTKLIVQCATGTGPDIIDLYSLEAIVTLKDAGILMDLTPYAPSMGFSADRTYASLHDGVVFDGHQYAFPCNVHANCIIYNTEVFDDHDVPYPKPGWTWHDFIRTCQLLQQNPSHSGRKHATFANAGGIGMISDLLVGCGARMFSPDGRTSALDEPPAVAALQFYHDLIFVHKAIPSVRELTTMSTQGGWGGGSLNIFSSGRAAMISIGRWYIVQLPNWPRLRGHLAVVQLPRMEGRPSCAVVRTRAAGINAMSPHRQEAMKFLAYLASTDYGRLIVQGGDGLPPNPALAQRGEDLVNDLVADSQFHQPFINAVRTGRVLDVSPYIDAQLVARWLGERIEAMENGLVEPRPAMRELAAEINRRIERNIQRRGL